MAKVTLVLEDEAAGTVNIKMESEPAWPGPAAKDQSMTTAQLMGIRFLDWLRSQSKTPSKAARKRRA